MSALGFEPRIERMALPAVPAQTLEIPRLPRWATAVSALVLILALLLLAAQWREPALRRLQIEGRFDRVQAQAVREAAAGSLSGGFFSVPIEQVRDAVAALPWVARTRVERVWPTGLRIRVWEREPYARWNADSLLDTGAVAFTPAAGDLPAAVLDLLPRLGGTPGNEQLVRDTYREMSERLLGTPFALAGLQLDARGEWTAQTTAGVELRLGQGRAQDKLQIITGALPDALGDRLPAVAYVDLRYTNGFAIGWRDDAQPLAAGDKKHG